MQLDPRVTIVLVDDDEGHTELVRRNLRRAGIDNELVCFESGLPALDFVMRLGRYAERSNNAGVLMLLDINMPGVDGVEVLRRVKSNPDTRAIPVIMLTTTDDPREVSRCYGLGCNVYVTKPIQPSAFLEAIKRLGLFLSIIKIPEGNAEPP